MATRFFGIVSGMMAVGGQRGWCPIYVRGSTSSGELGAIDRRLDDVLLEVNRTRISYKTRTDAPGSLGGHDGV